MIVEIIILVWLLLILAMILPEINKYFNKDPEMEKIKQREADGYYERWAEAYIKGEIGVNDEIE